MELDCSKLKGRLRDICRGHDDEGRPVLTPEKCAEYRRKLAAQQGVVVTDVIAADKPGRRGRLRRVSIEERRRKVAQSAARQRRLIAWVLSCRQEGESGLGDILVRMVEEATGKEILSDLRRILRVCSCSEEEAIVRLNAQYPA